MYPKTNELDKRAENRYQLTLLIAKRAKAIAEGYPIFTDQYEDIPILAASDEIDKDLISYQKKSDMSDFVSKPSGGGKQAEVLVKTKSKKPTKIIAK